MKYGRKIINTLLHNVAHTYHPDNTELIPQANYSLQDNNDSVPSHQFSLNQIYVKNSDTPPKIFHLYNVQPKSHTSKPRVFRSFHTLQKISRL